MRMMVCSSDSNILEAYLNDGLVLGANVTKLVEIDKTPEYLEKMKKFIQNAVQNRVDNIINEWLPLEVHKRHATVKIIIDEEEQGETGETTLAQQRQKVAEKAISELDPVINRFNDAFKGISYQTIYMARNLRKFASLAEDQLMTYQELMDKMKSNDKHVSSFNS